MPDWKAIPGLVERLRSRTVVDEETGCHIWQGWKNHKGYGEIDYALDDRRPKAKTHRVAFELAKGPIPDGLQIDHLCRNRACCNPDHLEAVTLQENLARSWEGRPGPRCGGDTKRSSKTHCRRGHEFTPENTFVNGPRRECRECRTLLVPDWPTRKAITAELRRLKASVVPAREDLK